MPWRENLVGFGGRVDAPSLDGFLSPRQVMFLKKEHDKAIRCYRDVLRRKPNNYKALEKLIGLLRRAGQLNEVHYSPYVFLPAVFRYEKHSLQIHDERETVFS